MPHDPQNDNEDPRDRNEGGFNWRGVILLLVAFMLFALAFLGPGGRMVGGKPLSYSQFKEKLASGKIIADHDQHPLRFVEYEGRTKTVISGYYQAEIPPDIKKPDDRAVRFQTVNFSVWKLVEQTVSCWWICAMC